MTARIEHVRRALVRAAAVVLTLSLGGSPARADAPPPRDRLTPLFRAVEESDPSLSSAAAEVLRARGDLGLPDPATLFAESSASAAELATAQRLADGVEAWTGAMTADGAWRFVMVESASTAGRRHARACARAVAALAAGATAVTDRATDAADRAAAEGRPIVEDEELAHAIHVRQVVLPLRASRAVLAVAASDDSAERRRNLATMALEACLRVEAVSAWSESERFLLAGWALGMLGRDEEASAAFEKARAAGSAKDAPGVVRESSTVESSLGSALALIRLRGPVTAREYLVPRLKEPAFAQGRSGLLASLAAIDVLMRIAQDEAAMLQDASSRGSALAWPWKQAQDLANRSDDASRALMYAHLGRRATDGAPYDRLPAAARVTRARALLEGETPRTAVALDVLDPLAKPESPPMDAVGRDAWLFYSAAGESSDAVSILKRSAEIGLAFASCCGDDPRVLRALASSARASERRLRAATDVAAASDAEADLLRALRALDSGPFLVEDSARDPWRLALGEVLLGLARAGPLDRAIEHANEATAVLRRITGDEASLEAETLLARLWSAALRLAEDEGSEDAPITRLADLLGELTDPRRSRAAGSRSTRPDLRDVMTACRSQSLMARGRPADALTELESLISDERLDSAPPLAVEVAIGAHAALEHEPEATRLAMRLDDGAMVTSRLSRLAWRAVRPGTEGFVAGEPPIGSPPITVFRVAAETARDADQALAHRTRLGWALLLAGRAPQAAEVFRAVEAADPRNASVMRGLGEALLETGDEAGAFTRFSALAQALEALQEHSRDYWHAWTRMLEILSRRPRTPDSDATIRREIARLRGMASALEQPDCMARLSRVEAALDRGG